MEYYSADYNGDDYDVCGLCGVRTELSDLVKCECCDRAQNVDCKHDEFAPVDATVAKRYAAYIGVDDEDDKNILATARCKRCVDLNPDSFDIGRDMLKALHEGKHAEKPSDEDIAIYAVYKAFMVPRIKQLYAKERQEFEAHVDEELAKQAAKKRKHEENGEPESVKKSKSGDAEAAEGEDEEGESEEDDEDDDESD
jgi:hypothetical protein